MEQDDGFALRMKLPFGDTSMVIRTQSVRWSAFLAALVFGIASAASAADNYPLRPPDTSSPRATLQGFIAATDDIYRRMKSVMENYAESGRLYPTSEERQERLAALSDAAKLSRYLDLSSMQPTILPTSNGISSRQERTSRSAIKAYDGCPSCEFGRGVANRV
jgi:hypothetical protein